MSKKIYIALQFLTIFNLKRDLQPTREEIGSSSVFFPLIGLFLGLVLVSSGVLMQYVLPWSLVNLFILIGLFFFTGGMHVDGLCDTLDGFMGGKDKESIVRIMKDSSAGAFGVWGIVISVILKFILLDTMPGEIWSSALISMLIISRFSNVHLGYISFCSDNTGTGLGSAITDNVKKNEFIGALIITLICTFFLLGIKGFIIIGMIFFITTAVDIVATKKIGGVTGDVMGAAVEINEICVLLFSLILFNSNMQEGMWV